MAEVKEEAKKKTTTKKKTSGNKTTTKRKRSTKKATPKVVEEVKVENTVETTPVEEVKVEEFDPKTVEIEQIDTEEERNEIAETIKEENKNEIAEIKEEIKESNELTSKDKITDAGIVVVVIGLFILVLTTYLTSVIELSYQETNILVIVALTVEAIGVAVMLVGTFSKNK